MTEASLTQTTKLTLQIKILTEMLTIARTTAIFTLRQNLTMYSITLFMDIRLLLQVSAHHFNQHVTQLL